VGSIIKTLAIVRPSDYLLVIRVTALGAAAWAFELW